MVWRDAAFEYVGFVSSFSILGAVGFRFGVLRASDIARSEAHRLAASRAASVGMLGAVLGAASFFEGLVKRAATKHVTVQAAFDAGGSPAIVQTALLGLLLVLFLLAHRSALAWSFAGTAALCFAVRNILSGRLAAMVNPLHVMGASLWLGTLFVLVTCGIATMLQPAVPSAERESAVAEMVHRFSRLALASAALLGITGVVTAWTHLNPFSALWSTPYGYVLIAKLCVVSVVAALGAWNWRKVGPALGREGGARMIRRSASTELAFAALVLALTAILVSLPSPKLPHIG